MAIPSWAALSGFIARHGQAEAARILGVSAGYLGETYRGFSAKRGGAKRTAAARDHLRQHVADAGINLRTARDYTPKGQKSYRRDHPLPEGTSRKQERGRAAVHDTRAGILNRPGRLVGREDKRDANGAIVGRQVMTSVSYQKLEALILDGMERIGPDLDWVIAFYGDVYTSGKRFSGGGGELVRRWVSARLPGTVIFDTLRDTHAGYEETRRIRPINIDPKAEARERKELREGISAAFATAITGLNWVRVVAVWIAPAKEY